jgi:hypothetical protein
MYLLSNVVVLQYRPSSGMFFVNWPGNASLRVMKILLIIARR